MDKENIRGTTLKRVGFTSGYFDIMHPGHVLMLKECKRYCDYLIVAVHEYKTKTKQPDDG